MWSLYPTALQIIYILLLDSWYVCKCVWALDSDINHNYHQMTLSFKCTLPTNCVPLLTQIFSNYDFFVCFSGTSCTVKTLWVIDDVYKVYPVHMTSLVLSKPLKKITQHNVVFKGETVHIGQFCTSCEHNFIVVHKFLKISALPSSYSFGGCRVWCINTLT